MRPNFLPFLLIAPICLMSCSGSGPAENTTEANAVKTGGNPWQKVPVTDEFGDLLEGQFLIAAEFTGTMTNSAVADAPLTVKMVVEDSTLFARFYEYGREPETKLPNAEILTIKVKTEDGTVQKMEQFLVKNVMLDMKGELKNLLLNQSTPVKVMLDLSTVGSFSNSVYTFEVDPAGFRESLD